MAKNIVIFSDGTGQRSGEHFEESRTNVYKLYRACKCGPDSSVDPSDQFAFYDPGIGTLSPGLGPLDAVVTKIYNVVCQATGLGLTRNIEQCYAAIVKVWEPGDRIFLFGFSRGAYTVRCLGSVLKYCGIPTKPPEGGKLLRSAPALSCLAKDAVERVYQHVGGQKRTWANAERFFEQRRLLAARFRTDWSSADAPPHFIGVFDTVATVGNLSSQIVAAALAAVVALALAGGLSLFGGDFLHWLWRVILFAVVIGGIWYLATHLKVAFGLEGCPWWATLHLNPVQMRFYDTTLDPAVGWARHAMAIDEHRADFDRVPWGNTTELRDVGEGEPDWLRQIWFAGNHADVGGGYPEPESRLSDAALKWMVGEARAVPQPLLVDETVLKTWPAADGMQHDETKTFPFAWGKKKLRDIDHDAPLDPLVIERLKLAAVLQYDVEAPYRPENLRRHDIAGRCF